MSEQEPRDEGETVEFYHKGWFGICPVYVSRHDDPMPTITYRHWTLMPLFPLSEWGLRAWGFVAGLFFPQRDSRWSLWITEDLETPVVMVFDGE